MIVADTGAVLALLDRDSPFHSVLSQTFDTTGAEWVVPWAVLPEIDYLVTRRFGAAASRAFLVGVLEGQPGVEWGSRADLERALALDRQYADLGLGLVDSVVMAVSERVGARAIVTLDQRDFGSVELEGRPQIWPRDLPAAGWRGRG